jgi:carotenoid cleavage dioxygenase-like enzyme
MSFGWIPPSNSIHFYTHKGDKLVFSDRIPFEGPLVIERSHFVLFHFLSLQPRMPHDFACSEQYCVFFDSTSIRMDPIRLLGFSPRDTVPARMVYFPRKSRGTRSVAVDNGSIVHFGNAWEEGDELVVMGCRSNETVLYFDLEREDRYLPYLYEYRINLVSNKVSERYLLDQNGAKIAGEFPTVHPGLATRATRFVYMMKLDRGGVAKSGGMFKYDRQLGISTSFGKGFVFLVLFFV